MKAVVVHQYGGPEVLMFEEYPDPVPGPGEVLVRVAATSVNPIDYKRRAGLTKDLYPNDAFTELQEGTFLKEAARP
jgi:NADPH:quinone reductase-like Zn-dependent oxidoreductase